MLQGRIQIAACPVLRPLLGMTAAHIAPHCSWGVALQFLLFLIFNKLLLLLLLRVPR
jgi:hypothetical protein